MRVWMPWFRWSPKLSWGIERTVFRRWRSLGIRWGFWDWHVRLWTITNSEVKE